MKKIEKNALVPFSAEQMYQLVDDIDRYHEFLPWCSQSEVLDRTAQTVKGRLTISYSQLNKSFVTENINTLNEKIEMRLIEGPFKELSGTWIFIPLGNDGCKVELRMSFEFENRLLDMTVGPIFGKLANSLVDAFTERAMAIYG